MVFASVLNMGIATLLCYHNADKALVWVTFNCLSIPTWALLGTFSAYILTGSQSPYITIIPLPVATTPSCLHVYSGIFNPVPNPHIMHERSFKERLAENGQLSGKPCKLIRRETVEKCTREGGIPVPGLWGWLKGQDECHISVFTSCPKASKSAGAIHWGQIKYLSSPCCAVKIISVSCSFLAPCIYLPLLPVLIWDASFLSLLPVVTCLMQVVSVFGTLRACPQDRVLLVKYVFLQLNHNPLPRLHGRVCLGTHGALCELQFKWLFSCSVSET